MFILLGLLMVIPSFGVGYLLNSLSRRWWLSLPIFTLAGFVILLAGSFQQSGVEWFAILVAFAGGVLSSVAMWQLKRGSYRKFTSGSKSTK